MPRTVVSLSGGLDSCVLLGMLYKTYNLAADRAPKLSPRREIIAVSFRYKSKHNAHELQAANNIARHYGIEHRIVNLNPIFNQMEMPGCSLTRNDLSIPEGHYNEETMRSTVVPARNLIFASILAGIAASGPDGNSEIALGVHAGDHHIYPDCRPEFISSLATTIELGVKDKDNNSPEVNTPFLRIDKVMIVELGLKINAPLNLTRTCYKDQVKACGKCGSCQERLEAFEKNNAKDPIPYE